MSDISQAYRQAMVNYLRGNGAPTAIADVFVDIYNGDPQAGGASVLNTITGSAVRPSVKSVMSAASAAAPSVSANNAQVQLSASAAAGGTITHIGLFDASGSGNLIGSHALTSGNQVVTAGNPVNIPVGALSLSI